MINNQQYSNIIQIDFQQNKQNIHEPIQKLTIMNQKHFKSHNLEYINDLVEGWTESNNFHTPQSNLFQRLQENLNFYEQQKRKQDIMNKKSLKDKAKSNIIKLPVLRDNLSSKNLSKQIVSDKIFKLKSQEDHQKNLKKKSVSLKQKFVLFNQNEPIPKKSGTYDKSIRDIIGNDQGYKDKKNRKYTLKIQRLQMPKENEPEFSDNQFFKDKFKNLPSLKFL